MSRTLARTRDLLERPGAWLAEERGGYALRLAPDRRGRVVLRLDEAAFRALIETPGLRRRAEGGWTGRGAGAEAASPPPPGRPGVIEGTRIVMTPDGGHARRRANLGESPIAWLARRKDAAGRPWLTPAQAAAGERLRQDAEAAASGPAITMRWDALPRHGGGTSARVEPGDRAHAAARRVERALAAAGPTLRPVLVRICIQGDSLKLAETGLGLPRRHGKTMLRDALQALAGHYGAG